MPLSVRLPLVPRPVLAMLAALVALAGGCSDSTSSGGVDRIEIALDTEPMLVGQVRPVAATPRDGDDEAITGATTSWRSTAPWIASVATGAVTAHTEGQAWIVASAGGRSDSVRVVVERFVPVRIEVADDSLELRAGTSALLTAAAFDARGRTAAADLEWFSSDTSIASIISSVVVAKRAGTVELTAVTASARSAPLRLRVLPVFEARALWVNRFEYDSPAKVAEIMGVAAATGFNIVYFQVRGAADAYYRSDLEPCAVGLCGALGGTPSWDPLEVAVQQAHAHGLELHAWLNAFTGWGAGSAASCALLRESSPRHLLLEHPEWRVVSSGGTAHPCPNGEEYVWLNPAVPQVRTRLARVAADIVRRYAVDGIHLDRIRWPGTDWSYDAATIAAFGKDPRVAANSADWARFRRDQVSLAVRETRDSMRAVRANAVLSAAVWGIHEPQPGWAASSGYSQYFQDPRAWARDGYLDVAVPMTYFRSAPAECVGVDWGCLLDDHLRGIQAATGTPVYIGVQAAFGVDEVDRQITLGRARGVRGFAFYSWSALTPALRDALRTGAFAGAAEVPR